MTRENMLLSAINTKKDRKRKDMAKQIENIQNLRGSQKEFYQLMRHQEVPLNKKQ
jgi:hypothetical protein